MVQRPARAGAEAIYSTRRYAMKKRWSTPTLLGAAAAALLLTPLYADAQVILSTGRNFMPYYGGFGGGYGPYAGYGPWGGYGGYPPYRFPTTGHRTPFGYNPYTPGMFGHNPTAYN